MLELIKIKPQTLKEYLKVDFNREVYDFYHQCFKVKTGIEDINILDFLNSVYEITSRFIHNCYELPYETNSFMIELCDEPNDDYKSIIERAFLITVVQNSIFNMGEQIIPKENGGYNLIENSYILGNNGLWTYWKSFNSLINRASEKLKERDSKLCFESDIREVYYRDFCDRGKKDIVIRIQEHQDYLKAIINPNNIKVVSKTKPILINGVKPNISERYKIANEVLDIYKEINSRNISATEKHKLLAHIMGCSQQTARELFNGTQIKRTSIRDEVINPYLDTLK